MIRRKRYKVLLSKDALTDIKETKRYILTTFKYRGYAESFSKKIKEAIQQLEIFPTSYEKTGYTIEDLDIYCKIYNTYLIFFVIENSVVYVIRVLKDRVYWQSIIGKMKKIINRRLTVAYLHSILKLVSNCQPFYF